MDEARRLIAAGAISGGMIPKVETCLYALDAGVEAAVILRRPTATANCNGQVEHAVLLELLTDLGAETLIHR